MALAVGPYGIEYDPRRREPESPVPRLLVLLIFVVALISLGVTIVKRVWLTPPEAVVVQVVPPKPIVPAEPTPPPPPPPPPQQQSEILAQVGIENRPVKVRNLLLRLEEAEKRRDWAMAVTTIEQICSLPGDPAHDLYDKLYRRAGELNVQRLFEEHNAQWVSEVTVKVGENATRIAARQGSTLASLKQLNPTVDVEKLRAGQKIKVMNRPRFNLIVHVRTQTADLKLNGRFFKRYDLRAPVTGAIGAYETTTPLRNLLAEKGIWFDRADRTEIETLIPKGSLLIISEL